MKKDTAGVAGAARIDQLSMAELTHAELHGKRLDKTGKSRAITNDPPLTTTGLDLNELYRRHVAGAFIPKCRAKAMQVVVQFPKDLVDGDDAALMLHHARAFVEEVFGSESIFADRVDRDEKSRHVVDVFIAPRYIKTTKHTEKLAVTMSVYQKRLAAKYDCPPIPSGTGRALQDALFEYLRDRMGLKGVKRGEPKMIPGCDWKLAEQLRTEELDEQKARADAREVDLNDRVMRVDAHAEKIAAREERVEKVTRDAEQASAAAEADRAAQAALRADLERALLDAENDRRAASTMRETADVAKQQADADRRAAIAALAAAERQRKLHDDAVADQHRWLADTGAAATADRAKAEAMLNAAAAERQKVFADRQRIDDHRALHVAQLALLARAADEENGLDLRATGKTFALRDSRMTDPERATYKQPWSAPLIAIARSLATALESVRDLARRVAGREKTIRDREVAAEAQELELARARTEHEAQLAQHNVAIAELDRRREALDAVEIRAEATLADANATLAVARAVQADADALLSHHRRWVRAMDALKANPDWVEIDPLGGLRLDPAIARSSPPELLATLREQAPTWAVALAAQRLELSDGLRAADDRERQAAYATERLTDMIDKAGSVLTPAQQAMVTDATRIAQQFGAARDDLTR